MQGIQSGVPKSAQTTPTMQEPQQQTSQGYAPQDFPGLKKLIDYVHTLTDQGYLKQQVQDYLKQVMLDEQWEMKLQMALM